MVRHRRTGQRPDVRGVPAKAVLAVHQLSALRVGIACKMRLVNDRYVAGSLNDPRVPARVVITAYDNLRQDRCPKRLVPTTKLILPLRHGNRRTKHRDPPRAKLVRGEDRLRCFADAHLVRQERYAPAREEVATDDLVSSGLARGVSLLGKKRQGRPGR